MIHHQLDPMLGAVATSAASIGGATAVVAQSALTDGLDPTTGWAGGIIVGGVAVFGLWFRYWSKGEAARIAERREADKAKDERIDALESELRAEREKYERLLRGDR